MPSDATATPDGQLATVSASSRCCFRLYRLEIERLAVDDVAALVKWSQNHAAGQYALAIVL